MIGCLAPLQKEMEIVAWLRSDTSIPACGRYCAQNLPNDFGLLPHSGKRNGYCRLAYYSRPGCRGGKIPTDQCEQLDIRYPGRMGHLEAGTRFILSWERAVKKAGRIDACVADNVLVLRWQAGGEIEREHRIQILSTACKYGGDRPWFKCPDQRCGRRVAILYRQGQSFVCRHCAGLAYRTQREERSLRLIRRAQAIRRSLGASAELRDLVDADFPPKPVGMHQQTYERLRTEYDRALEISFCH
jgi:hypothetical protein